VIGSAAAMFHVKHSPVCWWRRTVRRAFYAW